MKRLTCLLITAVMMFSAGAALAQWKKPKAPDKRNYFDLYGESLQSRLWSIGLVDINGLAGGSSALTGEAWGFVTEQGYNVNYSDKYKKITATFKVGFYFWGVTGMPYFSTELFDVRLTPFTFQKVWLPGFQATLKTPMHNGNMFFSRTSNTTVGTEASSTYLIAMRDEFPVKFGEVNLKVGATYMHHWKDSGLIDENAYTGNVAGANITPETFIFVIRDSTPNDGNGAKVYSTSIFVDDVEYVVGLATVPMEANGTSVLYTIRDIGAAIAPSTKSVKIVMEVAGDYQISVMTDKDPTERTIVRASGHVTDASNRQVITYNYGISTGSDVYGVTALGTVYGTNVEMEADFNNQYRKYPNLDGTRDLSVYPVFYIKADRKIDFTGLKFIDNKLTVSGDYFYTHPSYLSPNYASNFENFTYVDDNDDYDWYVDGSGRGTGGIMCNPVPQYHIAYDRDSVLGADWEQDLFLFTVDPVRFWTGQDRNNNGITDMFEDDALPDYPYRLNRQGGGINLAYPLLKDVEVNGGYDNFMEASGSQKTTNLYLSTKYSTKVNNFGDVTVWHNIKRAQDDIPDDLVVLKSVDDPNISYTGSDPLDYKDSILNNFYVETRYSAYKGLTVSNKFKMDNNYQVAELRNVRWTGFITGAQYDWAPTKLFTLSPMWKCWLEKGFSSPEYSLYSSERQLNAFLLKAVYKLFDKTTITGGVQYKLVRFPLDTSYEYDKLTFAFQLVSKSGSYPLVLGYVRNLTYPIHDASKYTKDETTFIKIYSTR